MKSNKILESLYFYNYYVFFYIVMNKIIEKNPYSLTKSHGVERVSNTFTESTKLCFVNVLFIILRNIWLLGTLHES